MPITPGIRTRRIPQVEFSRMAYEVMKQIFEIHSEFGRFFDEQVYQRELALRFKEVQLEVHVDITHETYIKRYFADAIVAHSGLFELKTVESIHTRHRSQTIHYLLLFDLAHAKLVNLRSDKVEHEFINTHQRLSNLRDPAIQEKEWQPKWPRASEFRDRLVGLVKDWGTGLDLALYEEAMDHLLAEGLPIGSAIPVFGREGPLGTQRVRLITPEIAFKLTKFPEATESFRNHALKLLRHTPLKAIYWANLNNQHLTLTTIRS